MLVVSVGLTGCVRLGVTYFDPTTYQNLTDVKPRVETLYSTFSTDVIDTIEVQSIRLKLSQIYEYESGKGPDNAATTKQIDFIRGMFDRHTSSRLQDGQWSSVMFQNNKESILRLFDIAIETERLKNKNN